MFVNPVLINPVDIFSYKKTIVWSVQDTIESVLAKIGVFVMSTKLWPSF